MANTLDTTNSAWGIRSDLKIFLQRKAAKYVRSTLFDVVPTLEFFFALNGQAKKDGSIGLGTPNTGIMVSSSGVAQAKKEQIYAERIYLPLIQKTAPSKGDVKAMTDYDSDPVVPDWQGSNRPLFRFTQPRVKFARLKMPYKIPHSDLRTAMANSTTEGQAASAFTVYDAEVKNRIAALTDKLDDMLWGLDGNSGLPTDEDPTNWDRFHSIPAALSDGTNGPGTFYCGVDRSTLPAGEAGYYWKGNYITTATSANFYNIIDQCNYDGFSGTGSVGFASRGGGVQLIVVGATLFKQAKVEAKAENYQVIVNGIREYPEYGFKREVVRIYSGNRPVYVFFDPRIPSGALAALSPDTFTTSIHPKSNFAVSTPADQTKVEGGDEADTGTIAVEPLIVCEVPRFNAYYTNVG